MFISYLITALVVFSLIGSVVYAMWKCAQKIAFVLSIFLFIILLLVVVKVFFNQENLSKLHSNIENSQIDQITQNAVKESVESAQKILNSTPAPVESTPAPAPAPVAVPTQASTEPLAAQAAPAVSVPAVKPPVTAPVKKEAPATKPAKKLEDNLVDLL